MIAVAILAMVIVSLLGLKNRSMQDVMKAERITTATLLAKRMMTEALIKGPLLVLLRTKGCSPRTCMGTCIRTIAGRKRSLATPIPK